MTIGTTAPRVSLLANGVTQIFAVQIQAYLATDFEVLLTNAATGQSTLLVLNSDYTMATSGTMAPPEWNLTTTLVYATGFTIQVILNPAQTQQAQFVQGQAFPSLAVQTAFDRNVQMSQRLLDLVSRSISAPDGDVSPVMLLPNARTRASTNLGFDSNGNVSTSVALASGTLSQAIIGSFLYPQTAAEAAAGVTPSNYAYPPYDLRRYGGDSTGSAASDTAMSNAIAVCGTTGGRISCPTGTYKFASQIDLTNKFCITIDGDGGRTSNGSTATTLTYSGTTAPFIKAQSSHGCGIEKLQITTSNGGFTGAFIKGGNDGSHGDCFQLLVSDVWLNCQSQCVGIDLDKTIVCNIQRTYISAGKPCLTGQSSAGGSYSVGVTIEKCHFNCAISSYNIGYLGLGWNIINNVFEPDANGVMVAIQNTTSTLAEGLVIQGNWIGDSTTTSSPITLSGYGIQITGNFVNGDAGGMTSALIFLTTASGVQISGNSFFNANYILGFGDANCRGVSFKDNYWAAISTPIGQYNTLAPYDLEYGPNYPRVTPPSGALYGNAASNGFEVSPNGIVRMWGAKTVTQGTPLAITFSTEVGRAFPNAFFTGNANAATAAYSVSVSNGSTTGVTLTLNGGAGSSTVFWQAIGN